jgi:hypothetical protein
MILVQIPISSNSKREEATFHALAKYNCKSIYRICNNSLLVAPASSSVLTPHFPALKRGALLPAARCMIKINSHFLLLSNCILPANGLALVFCTSRQVLDMHDLP